MRKEKEVLKQIIEWADNKDGIRSVILTSSLVNPKATVDILSDYDVVLVVRDIDVFSKDDSWLLDFGKILTSFKDKFVWDEFDGLDSYTRLVIYNDGLRIDFSLWSVELLENISEEPKLPEFLDIGYKVLLDKDDLTTNLKEPTHTAYATTKPTESEYLKIVDEFWWNSTYVAKSLWRDELYFAKYMLDYFIRFEHLKKMIEWHIGMRYNWSVNTNKCGRWFKKYLDKETWSELESTYAGADIGDNWKALFNTTDFFRKLSIEVSSELGYEYPLELDNRVTVYLYKIQKLEKDAIDF